MRLSSGKLPDEPEINLVSLIDVVFCLIVFLVVTTTFDHRAALNLVLPTAQQPAPVEEVAPLVLVVDAEGRYFLDQDEVLRRDTASLKEAIARVAGADRQRPVVIRGDARAPVQALVTAMDALGQLGFTRIRIATAPEARP
ncbi:ExbD/TolR family protein [Arenimonas fontis]|uniref:Biopolymer transporter ExbD n=1 Tax=Arenimonas fontis TaxID=2608255 RepID=A0A5B2ZAY9_9GAMM|nr:biopolymer transporter ExbD [Arenimonas fontis]KAA2284430.1 biopolymer transporter ExbD [Arenimonas fontis]